jgi:ice-binding like protein/uncharacterized protein DUF4082
MVESKCGSANSTNANSTKRMSAFVLGATVACLTVANLAAAQGPAPVHLGSAGTFAILSKSGITDVYASAIVGDVGTSPITGAALLLTCGEVSGKIYTVDAAGPLPCAATDPSFLTVAVGDMGFAYDDAAGRVGPDFTELGAGEIGGLTLAPGIYKWGTGLLISTNVTLSGGPDDVWIFQVAGTMNQASATRVTLAGGAQASNIFWQVAGAVTIGTTAHFEGIILGKTMIAVNTGASVNGRLLAQTAVTLQMNAVTQPAVAQPVVTQPACEYTIWNASDAPGQIATDDGGAVELGLRFRADANGVITGVRFYKAATNTGTHVGSLWTNSGTLLATATFTGETASGWQQVDFTAPVAVSANATYVVSYHTNTGNYGFDGGYFTSAGVDNGPLHALADGADGANGVFLYGAGGFPTKSFNGANYWVDIVYSRQ